MSSSIYSKISSKQTPQSEPAKKSQVKNNAGGYVFRVAPLKQLERFLILGSEGGTYYVGERALTLDNLKCLGRCLAEDHTEAIKLIASVSEEGRAAKNEQAIFALAAAASYEDTDAKKQQAVRQFALSKLPNVCRIPTHLFSFLKYARQFRGTGRSLRRAIGDWYKSMDPDKLAYELAKYQSRDGMSNRDVLRLCHPSIESPAIRWACDGASAVTAPRTVRRRLKGWSKASPLEREDVFAGHATLPRIIDGLERAKGATSPAELVKLISDYGLTREMIPTEFLPLPEVQEALLEHMPLHAMVRNLGNMSKSGLLKPYSFALGVVTKRLDDATYIRKSRLHPMALLIAQKVYEQGKGMRGKGTWEVNQSVVEALDAAFYKAFDNAEPTGKRLLYALDISSSMQSPISAEVPLTCAQGCAALAMLALHAEHEAPYIKGFSSTFIDLPLRKGMSLSQATTAISRLNFGSTDASLPATWALKHSIPLEGIVVITDNETWCGGKHPFQALKDYRSKMSIPLRQVVIGMTSSEFSIADPEDLLSLDVAGFDASAPPVVNSFLRGEI